MSTRHVRVGAELARLLNDMLRREIKDPRLEGVQVSEVEMSPDLGVARVYFSMLEPDAATAEAERAFESAAGFIRRRVGQALQLRRVPELRFLHDESARRGMEISQMIDRARRDDSD